MKLLAVKKVRAKDWFTIIAPKIFNEKEIGKTLTAKSESLIGKSLSLSAVELTNDFSKYYLKFSFRINRIDGDKAYTELSGLECLRDYISRMVVRRVRRIDEIQDLITKDNVKIRVKSLGIVTRRVKSSIEVKIREFIHQTIKKEVESMTLEEFIKKLVANEIKTNILKFGRRIYPIRNFEVRKVEIIH